MSDTRLYAKKKHEGIVTALALTQDDRIPASGGADNRIILWNAQTLTVLSKTSTTSTVNALAFAPDETLAVALNDGTIRLYQLNGNRLKLINTLAQHTDRVRTVALSRFRLDRSSSQRKALCI